MNALASRTDEGRKKQEELLKRVWGEEYLGESRTVDVHIGQLRKKLELYDEIKTIPKLGYRLED